MSRSGVREGLATGGVTAVALAVTVTVILVSGTMTPIEMLRPGDRGPSAQLVEEVLGPEVLAEDDVGYDGQQFWAIAETFPDLDRAAPHLDDPPYRFQRILTPALAATAGGGQASALLLVLLTLLGVALCVGCVTDLCVRHGRRPQNGYLAILPLAWAIGYGTSEPVAYGLGLLGACLADRRRFVPAAVLIALGGLARESAVVFGAGVVLGVAVVALRDRRRPPLAAVLPLLVPVAVVGGWTWWLRSNYEVISTEQRLVPFGIVDATTTGLLLGLLTLALAGLATWHWRDVWVVWPTALLFGAMVLTYYGPLFRAPALLRVSAPALTFGLAALVEMVLARQPAPRNSPADTGVDAV